MYKIAKVFQAMKKEADKDKKGHSRVKDSKAKEEPEAEMAALMVAKTVQDQIRDFKVNKTNRGNLLSVKMVFHVVIVLAVVLLFYFLAISVRGANILSLK